MGGWYVSAWNGLDVFVQYSMDCFLSLNFMCCFSYLLTSLGLFGVGSREKVWYGFVWAWGCPVVSNGRTCLGLVVPRVCAMKYGMNFPWVVPRG